MNIVVSFFLALFPLVLIHELGHFLVAKWNHVDVEEFGIGFPPRLVKLFERGGTEYTVNALPLGGFVRLLGEDDPDVPGAFASKSKRVRAAVLFAGPAANFLLAAVILTGVALAGIPTALPGFSGVAVAGVEEGMPAAQAGLQTGDIVVAVDGKPLAANADRDAPVDPEAGTPEMTALQEITDASTGRALKLTILRGITRVAESLPATGVTLEAARDPWLKDAQVIAAAPAETTLAKGDLVLSAPEAENKLLIVRPGPKLDITVVPALDEERQKGRMGILISTPNVPVPLGLVAATAYGVKATGRTLTQMAAALGSMVRRPSTADVKGPVGIAQMTSQAAQGGLDSFVAFMALLSLNLGLINLLPIPALDGGRLLFIGLEAVRGRRLEPRWEQAAHVVGFVVVVGLMVVLTAVEVAEILGFTGGTGPR